jgi:tetratricopeptide (TPR) repeat protein
MHGGAQLGRMTTTSGHSPEAEPEQHWLDLVDDLLGQAETAGDAAARTALLCRVAEIYERRLADPDAALVTLETAFKAEPASGRVMQELERFARGTSRWNEVIGLLASVAATLNDAKQSADLWVQIAFWNDSGLLDLEAAAESAREALELAPAHGGALALLESVYRRQRAWDAYIEILARKWDDPYRDHYKIAEGYEEVLRDDPAHRGALEGLARLYERTNQWLAAADTLRKLVTLASGAERVALHYRLGAILKDQLGETRAAEEQLAQGLALDSAQSHAPTMLALADLYRGRGDWLKARLMLERAAGVIAEPSEQTRLLHEAAEICRNKLDDEAQAAELYAAVLARDPSDLRAAGPVAEIRFRRGEWAALLPLAERLAAAADAEGRPAPERARLHHQLARAAEELGDVERAGSAYRAALDADGAHLPALRDFGALALRRELWSDVARTSEALLVDPAVSLRREETLEALERLGTALLRLGEPAKALPPLDRALALDPRRRTTLALLIEGAAAAGDFDAVVRHTQALAALTDDPAVKLALYERLAEVHRDQRHDPLPAIAAYRAALEIKPDAHPVLHKVLELLTETKQWKQAVDVLLRLADLGEGEARARSLEAAGNIMNYELGLTTEAVDLYDRALDADPTAFKTFERIDKLLTAAHDWKMQERCYRRQIKRMGNDVPLEQRPALLALWQGLGEIYRSRLKDYPSAIAAFEVAASLDPDSPERRADTGKILAELYRVAGPETYPKAIAEHRRLLAHAREAVDMATHLKMLLRLFVEIGELDHAFCAAQSLALLGRADGDERSLFEQYRPRRPVRARNRMNEELWQQSLFHPDQDRLLSHIFGLVGSTVAAARGKLHKDCGLKRKRRRDVAADPSLFCRALAYGSMVLGVPWPEVYLSPETAGGVDLINARDGLVPVPAIVVGRDAVEGRTDIELAYLVGFNLTLFRPDHLVRWRSVVPTAAELEVVARAAVKVVAPPVEVPPELADAVAQYATFLDKMLPPAAHEQLGVIVKRFVASGATVDLGRWTRAVGFTAARAGLLLAGDLETAARLARTQAAAEGIDGDEVARDLMAWNVSETYFTLRDQLGLGAVSLDAALR